MTPEQRSITIQTICYYVSQGQEDKAVEELARVELAAYKSGMTEAARIAAQDLEYMPFSVKRGVLLTVRDSIECARDEKKEV